MKNIDLDLLDELIKKCEAKMASPFKKKPKQEEPEESSDEPEATAMIIEKQEVLPSEEADEDLDALLELYKKIKS